MEMIGKNTHTHTHTQTQTDIDSMHFSLQRHDSRTHTCTHKTHTDTHSNKQEDVGSLLIHFPVFMIQVVCVCVVNALLSPARYDN